jgi:2'-5' RNA ligase
VHGGRPSTFPLIVTLLLDGAAQERFDRLRAAHFPARPLRASRPEQAEGGEDGTFRLAAHVTLFHALPGEHVDEVRRVLAAAADRPSFPVTVSRVRLLGRGVAFDVEAAELTALRTGLAAAFEPWLTRQDRQGGRAHVTVQNKVDPAAARALHAELAAGFTPEAVPARGLALWHYLGGPWRADAEFPFGC